MTPPSFPGSVTGHPSGGSVTLTWNAATDNVKVAGYRVQPQRHAHRQRTSGTSFTDKNVPAGTYTWSVQAYDAAGNYSGERMYIGTSNGSPKATAASRLKVVKSKGVLAVRVGGKSGQRLVLLFKLTQPFSRAVLHLRVLGGKAKVRVSLPAGSGRTTAGKRLGERPARKGVLKIPIGTRRPARCGSS